MTETLIPIIDAMINDEFVQTVNARDLHAFLKVGCDFTTWIKRRIAYYGFLEGVDHLLLKIEEQLPSGMKYKYEYHLTLDMAKELSMVERNEQGRQARRYFIACEKRMKEYLKSNPRPAQVMLEHMSGVLFEMPLPEVKTGISMVREARVLFGPAHARHLWKKIGFPTPQGFEDVPAACLVAASRPDASAPLGQEDGWACLRFLLSLETRGYTVGDVALRALIAWETHKSRNKVTEDANRLLRFYDLSVISHAGKAFLAVPISSAALDHITQKTPYRHQITSLLRAITPWKGSESVKIGGRCVRVTLINKELIEQALIGTAAHGAPVAA